MKSLRYRLSGRPRTLDDCLDLAGKHGVESVTVELVQRPLSYGYDVVLELAGRFHWSFADGTACCRVPMGGIPVGGDSAAKQRGLREANLRLAKCISTIEALKIPVRGDVAGFDSGNGFAGDPGEKAFPET